MLPECALQRALAEQRASSFAFTASARAAQSCTMQRQRQALRLCASDSVLQAQHRRAPNALVESYDKRLRAALQAAARALSA